MLGAAALATLADVPFGWEYHCFYGASLFRELDSSGTVYNEFPQAAQLVPAGAKAGESSAAAAAVSPSSTATERVRDARRGSRPRSGRETPTEELERARPDTT